MARWYVTYVAGYEHEMYETYYKTVEGDYPLHPSCVFELDDDREVCSIVKYGVCNVVADDFTVKWFKRSLMKGPISEVGFYPEYDDMHTQLGWYEIGEALFKGRPFGSFAGSFNPYPNDDVQRLAVEHYVACVPSMELSRLYRREITYSNYLRNFLDPGNMQDVEFYIRVLYNLQNPEDQERFLRYYSDQRDENFYGLGRADRETMLRRGRKRLVALIGE